MAGTKTLYEMAKVLRSKNSGPFELTLDIIFDDQEKYRIVKEANIINEDMICRLYNITLEKILNIVFFDAAMAIKITIMRPVVSGGIAETDVYGAQQHAPLINIRVPQP